MEKELLDALNLVSQVCGSFVGNLEQHKNIQGALELVTIKLNEKDDNAKDKK